MILRRYGIWLIVPAIGIVDAILLRAFEFAGIDGTAWLWETVFPSNSLRWLVVPLAIVLSLLLSVGIRALHQPRLVADTDLMSEVTSDAPVSLASLAAILAIGLASLLAGASLGPEASLMAASVGIGALAAGKAGLGGQKQLVILASVGALLIAFLNSLVMLAVPLLFLLQKKQLKLRTASLITLAGLASYATLRVMDQIFDQTDYSALPALPKLAANDFLVAALVGFAATLFALALNRLVVLISRLAQHLDRRLHWALSAALFGLALGLLYLVGGQSVQFSGSLGTHLLEHNAAKLSIIALGGLVLTKLFATSWSKATGYRGGLVFPSIYMGMALGLTVEKLNHGWGGAGAIIGGIAGMLSAVTASPVIAGIFVLAIMPFELFLVSVAAIVGSATCSYLLRSLKPAPPRPSQIASGGNPPD